MSFITNPFERKYQTVGQIELLSYNDILRLPPNEIKTTKILQEDEAASGTNKMDPIKRAAIMYIAEQKNMRDKYGMKYPEPNRMVENFTRRMKTDAQVRDLIEDAEAENVKDRLARLGGGRARRQSKKRQSQRKRKSQRRRRYTRNRS